MGSGGGWRSASCHQTARNRSARPYDWKHLEGENGFLTDQVLYMDTNILETTRSGFFNQWES